MSHACVLPQDTPDLVNLLLHHAEGTPKTAPAMRYDAGACVFLPLRCTCLVWLLPSLHHCQTQGSVRHDRTTKPS